MIPSHSIHEQIQHYATLTADRVLASLPTLASLAPAELAVVQVAAALGHEQTPALLHTLYQRHMSFLTQPCCDQSGSARPVYLWLLASAWLQALQSHPLAAGHGACATLCHQLTTHELATEPWAILWNLRLALQLGNQKLADHLLTLLPQAHQRGHLHPLDADTSLDAFVFAELTALHALQACVCLQAHPLLQNWLWAMTAYHQEHTTPDFTTSQPWGVAAFAANPATVMFAEQQLHDWQTYTRISAKPPSPLAATLLHDAALTSRQG
ncbi:MAG: hypothetical protein WCJ97_08150 [Phycisphaerae bacterium]